MPWSIIQGDISNLSFSVDAIVNVSHPNPNKIGLGVDRAIHKKAGPDLLKARINQGEIQRGESIPTLAYGLNARYVFHTLGPYWRDGKHGEEVVLRRCYDTALDLAIQKHCKTVAFPLIASGNQGFSISVAYRVATDAFRDFCEKHTTKIFLVVFDEETAAFCRKQRSVRRDKLPKNIPAVIATEYEENGEISSMEEVRNRIRDANALRTEHEDQIDQILEKNISKTVFDTLRDLVNYETDRRNISSTKFCQNFANLQPKHFLNQVASLKRDYSNSKIPKNTLLAYAVGLGLNVRQTSQLLSQADYVFPSKNQSDQIIAAFLSRGCWDIFQINVELFDNGQKILGSEKN